MGRVRLVERTCCAKRKTIEKEVVSIPSTAPEKRKLKELRPRKKKLRKVRQARPRSAQDGQKFRKINRRIGS